MKSRFLLILIAPIAAFIISCGSVDNLTDANQIDNPTAQVIDQNNDSADALNLSESNEDKYWLGYYIPWAYDFYMSTPFRWGFLWPYLRSIYTPGCSYSLTNPSAPFYPWVDYSVHI